MSDLARADTARGLRGHPPAPAGRRRLTRESIVATAVDYVDEHGVAGLTMRRLGARMHVQAMSLYSHVPSRENLLDAIVEAVVDELYADPEVHLEPREGGWEDYLTRLAFGVRRIALAHPRVFPLVATRPPAAPWVRPPLRSLRWMDSFLDGLLRSGFSDAGAAAVYRAFTSFLVGHLLLDVAALQVDTSVVADSSGDEDGPPGSGLVGPNPAEDPLAAYSQLQRLEPLLTEDHSAQEFAQSLTNLLERLRGF